MRTQAIAIEDNCTLRVPFLENRRSDVLARLRSTALAQEVVGGHDHEGHHDLADQVQESIGNNLQQCSSANMTMQNMTILPIKTQLFAVTSSLADITREYLSMRLAAA